MELMTEIVDEKQKALIISKKNYSFIDILRNEFKKVSIDFFYSPYLPHSIKQFNYLFIINGHVSLNELTKNKNSRFVYIFLNKKKLEIDKKSYPENIKIITVNSEFLEKKDIDKILWFAFSKTKETYLKLTVFKMKKTEIAPFPKITINLKKLLTKKNSFLFLLSSILLIHLAFIPFLFTSIFFNYQSYLSLKKEEYQNSQNLIYLGHSFYSFSKKLYAFVRPSYLLFNLALMPDNLIDLNEKSLIVIDESLTTLQNSKEIQRLLFKENKSPEEKSSLMLRLTKLQESLVLLEDSLNTLSQETPSNIANLSQFKQKLIETANNFGKAKEIIDYLKKVIVDEHPKKYLIFFVNNMELRPGGGFLGSFGIFEVGNYKIGEIKVYDVYDADGQLTAHLDPPKPIAKYLNVPHWFLRDSNFSPDLLENYRKALFFLEKEMNFTDFSGAILITTTGVENLLTTFGNIYLPDFKEYINNKNFYLKTQYYTEKNFFPGSTQKKTILSSIVREAFINSDHVSLSKLFLEIKKSLDEKQIVIYLDDNKTQALFDNSFWSGRVIEPKCPIPQENCIIDYLFPFDANVGANKANFFINRYINLKIDIDSQGKINHLLSIQYKNESPSEIFPTGYYRNYFQILLPKNSVLKQVTKDGVLIEEVDQRDDQFKTVGFFFEVPPKKTVEIKIEYQLADVIVKGRKIYQFIVQKQIGAKNSDFVLEFKLDKNIYILNQNFSPVVKDNQIVYNTNLSTDKIFFIELMKE
jgi:hypothetical protein